MCSYLKDGADGWWWGRLSVSPSALHPVKLAQWHFYIRGTWGTAPPDPDGAVVQKAQYICALWQNISYLINMQSSDSFVNVCVNKLDSQAL